MFSITSHFPFAANQPTITLPLADGANEARELLKAYDNDQHTRVVTQSLEGTYFDGVVTDLVRTSDDDWVKWHHGDVLVAHIYIEKS